MFNVLQIRDLPNIEKVVESAAKVGFKYVAIGFGENYIFHDDTWEDRVKYIKDLLDRAGLTCVQTHLPYYELRVSSEILDEALEKSMLRGIVATKMLGAKLAAMHPRSSVISDFDPKVSLQDNLKAIKGYLPTAEENDVIIAVENLAIFPGIPYEKFYVWNAFDLVDLVDAVNSPYCKICWDFGHAHLTGIDQVKALKHVGKRLCCTHVHNNFRRFDNHEVPTIGSMKWEEIMPIVEEIGYTGPMTLEVNYPNNRTLDDYLRLCLSSLEYLDELRG